VRCTIECDKWYRYYNAPVGKTCSVHESRMRNSGAMSAYDAAVAVAAAIGTCTFGFGTERHACCFIEDFVYTAIVF
jgi:hypothetical protein